MPRIPRHTPLLGSLSANEIVDDDALSARLANCRLCGVTADIGADMPEAANTTAPLRLQAFGWLVALVMWVIGLVAGQSMADVGWLSTPWAMALGAAWVFACIGMQRSTVHAIQQW